MIKHFLKVVGVKDALRESEFSLSPGALAPVIALSAPSLITIAGFSLFTLFSKEPLTPGVAFSVLALFNILRAPMLILPLAIAQAFLSNAPHNNALLRHFLTPPK